MPPVLNSRWATKFPELYNDKCKVVDVTGTSVTLQSESVNGTVTMSLTTFCKYAETGMVSKLTDYYACPACGSNRENLCACPNEKCPEAAPPRSKARKVIHSNLGECFVDESCLYMQRRNPDSTSMFVLHDCDMKEVTKAMVTETDFDRASGNCVCDWCNETYYAHPRYEKMPSYNGSFPLRQLCDGRVVKL